MMIICALKINDCSLSLYIKTTVCGGCIMVYVTGLLDKTSFGIIDGRVNGIITARTLFIIRVYADETYNIMNDEK